MLFLWQAASAFIVCLRLRSIGNLEKDFVVLFREKQPFENSSGDEYFLTSKDYCDTALTI